MGLMEGGGGIESSQPEARLFVGSVIFFHAIPSNGGGADPPGRKIGMPVGSTRAISLRSL
jgi:hypothetical protein